MEIKQTIRLAYPRGAVWAVLGDIEAVARCFPGASLTEPPGADGALKGQLAVKLGPIAAAFAGEGKLAQEEAVWSGTLSGTGSDRKSGSRAKGELRFVLHEEGAAATRVEAVVDFALMGALAQFGRGGIVNDLATRLAAEFAGNLERLLAERAVPPAPAAPSHAEPPTAPAASPPPVAAPPPQAAAPLDAGNLLGAVIWARIKAFFARLFGARS
jgi:uncharacterized protein